MDPPLIPWPAVLIASPDEDSSEMIDAGDGNTSEVRQFQINDPVVVHLPRRICPEDLDQNDLVPIIAYPFREDKDAKTRQVPRHILEIGSRSRIEGTKDVEVKSNDLELLPLPPPQFLGEGKARRLVKGAIWLLHKNSAMFRTIEGDAMDYLDAHIDTIGNIIWKATNESVATGLGSALRDVRGFDFKSFHPIQQATGTLKFGQNQTFSDRAAVIVESLEDESTHAIRVHYTNHLVNYITLGRWKSFPRVDLVKKDTKVTTHMICEFPLGTDESVIKIAAEAYALVFGSYHSYYDEDQNFQPLNAAKNPQGHVGFFRIAMLSQIREHLFFELGLLQLRIAGQPVGLNTDVQALTPSGKVKVVKQEQWFMADLGNVRRYFKSSPFIPGKPGRKNRQGAVTLLSNLKDIYIPEVLKTDGQARHPVWTFIDITKDKSPHGRPWARCPLTGSIENLVEANAVSIVCIAKLDKGWFGGYAQVPSRELYATVDYAGLKVPSAYAFCMTLINSLESPAHAGQLPMVVNPAGLTGPIAKIEVIRSWLEQKITLNIVNGPVNKQTKPIPRSITLAWNRVWLMQALPGTVLGDKPEGMERSVCDMCHLRKYNWEFPPTKPPAPRLPARNRCRVENGICAVWSYLHIPATWTAEEGLGDVLACIGFCPTFDEGFAVDEILIPFEVIDEKFLVEAEPTVDDNEAEAGDKEEGESEGDGEEDEDA